MGTTSSLVYESSKVLQSFSACFLSKGSASATDRLEKNGLVASLRLRWMLCSTVPNAGVVNINSLGLTSEWNAYKLQDCQSLQQMVDIYLYALGFQHTIHRSTLDLSRGVRLG